MRLPQIIIILLIVGFISQFLYYYPNLPEIIASHFNGTGEADSWMSKQGFIIFDAIILLIVILHFTLLPPFLKKLPDSLINLPNKKYWLATERRAETFNTLKTFFEWFAIALLGLFIAVNQLVFQANLAKQNLSAVGIWTIIGIFLTLTIIWLIVLTKHFKKTK